MTVMNNPIFSNFILNFKVSQINAKKIAHPIFLKCTDRGTSVEKKDQFI